MRRFWPLENAAGQLLDKPLRKKDRDIYFLLLVGLYQLQFMRTPEHAALSETVNGCTALGKTWAKKLVNGCLRSFLRTGISIDDSSHHYSHPDWLAEKISRAWPDYTDTILATNNVPPPMCLRINLNRVSRVDYLARLSDIDIRAGLDDMSETGLILDKGVPTDRLPGFNQGECSVQDTAAQLAAVLLDAKPGHRVLDACAAPGGKTGHILEHTQGLARLTALDISQERMGLVKKTLERQGMEATCIVADATMVAKWWDGVPFDRVLLDAPCSGTGVIRRHPDIRHHRRERDVDRIVERQSALLDAVWQTLRPGGILLYATCSILPEENEEQLRNFLTKHQNALVLDPGLSNAIQCEPGYQTLPGIHPCDGFYYCLVEKT
jgi:16S rRNA (cytosine967-C5)-methyltransferase